MIKRYEPSDCDELLDVWERATRSAHPFLRDDFLEVERRNIPHVYLPVAETWVWLADAHVAGFISLLGNEVGAVFVDPKSHRSGIGRTLMERAKDLRTELEVEEFERNPKGVAFYSSLGFSVVHRNVHEPTGFDVVRMRWAANSPPSTGSAADRSGLDG